MSRAKLLTGTHVRAAAPFCQVMVRFEFRTKQSYRQIKIAKPGPYEREGGGLEIDKVIGATLICYPSHSLNLPHYRHRRPGLSTWPKMMRRFPMQSVVSTDVERAVIQFTNRPVTESKS